jgi:hypothetical protein
MQTAGLPENLASIGPGAYTDIAFFSDSHSAAMQSGVVKIVSENTPKVIFIRVICARHRVN